MAQHCTRSAHQTCGGENRDNKEHRLAHLPTHVCNSGRIVRGRAKDASGTHEAFDANCDAWPLCSSDHARQTQCTREGNETVQTSSVSLILDLYGPWLGPEIALL